jgi:hypothetical protein
MAINLAHTNVVELHLMHLMLNWVLHLKQVDELRDQRRTLRLVVEYDGWVLVTQVLQVRIIRQDLRFQ